MKVVASVFMASLSSTVLVHASQIWTSGVWNNRIIALLEVVGVLLIFRSSVFCFIVVGT